MIKDIIIPASTTDTIVHIVIPDQSIQVTTEAAGLPPVETGDKVFPVISKQRTDDYIRPGAGMEVWNFENKVSAGTLLDEYYRFFWGDLEQATYNWSKFDQVAGAAIAAGRKFNFGIMPMYEGAGPSVGGAKLGYPSYLHTQMQGETVKDWNYNGTWIPNWNSNNYLTAWENLLLNLSAHIKSKGWQNNIGYVDIRGYGNFGEWHTYPWSANTPKGASATSASLIRIAQAHAKALPDTQLVAMLDGVSPDSGLPADASYYLLTGRNNRGEFGLRRDNWGNPGYDKVYANNTLSYNGAKFSDLILNKWKVAPVVGEPWIGDDAVNTKGSPYDDLVRQVELYHACIFGNGNFASIGPAMQANILAAGRAAGYRLGITGGRVTLGSQITISLDWSSTGVSPVYEDCIVQLSIGPWTAVSKFVPRLFSGKETFIDTYSRPVVVPGTYDLNISIIDVTGVRKNIPMNTSASCRITI